MSMTISDLQLRQAFESFVSAESARTGLAGADLQSYVTSLRETFEHYRLSDPGSLFETPRVLCLESRTPYVGYPGDQALKVELSPEADAETLGVAVRRVLDASRQMTLDYLEGRLLPLERAQGAAHHRAYMHLLCMRNGFKTQGAMLKVSRSVALTRNRHTGVTTVSPMRRVKADYFEGLGPDADIDVQADASPAQLGLVLRDALDCCA